MLQTRQTRGVTPQKPSRLQPTEPLHMTTRRAATKVNSNASGSNAGSTVSDESRRNSLADDVVYPLVDSREPTSPAQRRLSQESATTPSNPSQTSQQSATPKRSVRSASKGLPSIAAIASPSRKRKRTASSANGETPDGITEVIATTNGHKTTGSTPVEDCVMTDAVVTADMNIESPQPHIRITTIISPNATPLGSQIASPGGDSLLDEPEENGSKALHTGDAAKFPTGRPKRRLAGRRRAPHADPKVEAALRRQLELKTTYRAVSRALKPVLAEIALRTTNEIRDNAEAHKAAAEFSIVKAGLDAAYERRRGLVNRQYKLCSQGLLHRFEAECHLRRVQSMVSHYKARLL